MAERSSIELSQAIRSLLRPMQLTELDLAHTQHSFLAMASGGLGSAGTEGDQTRTLLERARSGFEAGPPVLSSLDTQLTTHFASAFSATEDRLATDRRQLGLDVEKGQGLLGGLQTGSLEDQPALSDADGAMVEQRDREPKVELEVAI